MIRTINLFIEGKTSYQLRRAPSSIRQSLLFYILYIQQQTYQMKCSHIKNKNDGSTIDPSPLNGQGVPLDFTLIPIC